MTTPTYKRIAPEDVTGDWGDDSTGITGVTGRFMSDATELLNGKLKVGNNLQAELKTLTVTTPKTDFVAIPDSAKVNSWVDYSAAENLAWRKDATGTAWLRGLIKTGSNPVCNITTLPTAIWPQSTHRRATTCQGNAGGETPARFDVSTAGVLNLQFSSAAVSPFVFVIIDTSWPTADLTPYPFSCFPIQWKSSLKTVSQVEIYRIQDTTSGASVLSAPTSNPAWSFTAAGFIIISNITGLTLGHSYNIYLRALP